MHLLETAAFITIAGTWIVAGRVGVGWVGLCGVNEPVSRLALGCVLPTGGLLLAVHVPATVSLFTDRGCVTPEVVAAGYVVLTLIARRFVGRACGDGFISAAPAELPVGDSVADPPAVGGVFCPWSVGWWRANSEWRMANGECKARRHSFDIRHSEFALLRWWWAPLGVIAGVYGVFLLDALTRFPTGYDAVAYHLVLAVQWARQRALDLVLGHSGFSYPNNAMIVPFLLASARLEGVLPVVHLPKALWLGAAVFGLARAMGVSRGGSVLAACVTLMIPIVVFQGFSGYADLYATSAWVTALLAVVWSTRCTGKRGRGSLLFLAGVAAGIAWGAKITCIVAVAVLLAVVVWAGEKGIKGPRDQGTKGRWRFCGRAWDAMAAWIGTDRTGVVRRVALFGLGVLACSGFWWVRGLVQAGSPIYPLTVEFPDGGFIPVVGVAAAGGTVTAAETFPDQPFVSSLGWLARYCWREEKCAAGYTYGVDNGLGAAFATFVPVGIAAMLLAVLRRGTPDGRARWSMVFTLIGLAGCVSLVTVFHNTLRFALPMIVVAIPAAAAGLDHWVARCPRFMALLLTAAVGTSGALAALRPAHSFFGRWRDGNWQRHWFYQIPPVVDRFGPGTRLLNLSNEVLNYPLLGEGWGNVVIGPLLWSVLSDGGAVTSDALTRDDIDYVFIRAPWPVDWPDDLPVELIFDDSASRALATTPAARIYRVIRTGDTRTSTEPPDGASAKHGAPPGSV